ncbi:MAG: hypothetical protein HY763_06820 [Planctomycetes bacterium]|nr:hypothetical protein [Planctomycetota bacterium]
MGRLVRSGCLAAVVSAAAAGVLSAAEPQPPKAGKAPAPVASSSLELQPTVAASMATIETILTNAVRGISARYNLNEAQTAETDALMKREVFKFLQDHEAEVWPLIRDLLAAQLGARPPSDVEEMKRIGAAAGPLAKLACDAIIRANKEWREILTPEQKKVHDFDMSEMEKTFEQIDRNFKDWAEGKPVEAPIFPATQPTAKGPPTPPKPVMQGLPRGPILTDNVFENFVEQFIKDYLLDEGQIDSARSILKEYKDKVADFRSGNKDELGRLANAIKEATEQRDYKKRTDAEAERKKLLEPVYELFAQMESRLKGLLNSVQLERYEANKRALDTKGPKTAASEKPAEAGAAPAAPSGEGSDAAAKPPAQEKKPEAPADAKPPAEKQDGKQDAKASDSGAAKSTVRKTQSSKTERPKAQPAPQPVKPEGQSGDSAAQPAEKKEPGKD